MADNTTLDTMSGGDTIATDDITSGVANGAKVQRVKVGFGADNSYVDVESTSTNPLPVATAAPTTGSTELCKAEDAASANGDVGIAMLTVRDDTLAANAGVTTDGDFTYLRVNNNGAAWVKHDGDITIADGGNSITVDGTVTETNSAAILADTASMDTNLGTIAGTVSGTELQVDIVTSALPTGAATASNQTTANTSLSTIAGDTTSLDGKVTACNTGAVTISSALPAGTNAIGKLAANSGVDIGDVDVTSIAAGANLIGDVGISGARTSGGTTPYRNVDVDETEDAIKTSAGQIYWIHCVTIDATPIYLHFYNATVASVTVGTTTPDLTFLVPSSGDANGGGFTLSIPNGIAFSTAITVAATTTVGGSTGPGTNEVILNCGYA